MNIIEALVRLRNDLKQWTTNNIIALRSEIAASESRIDDVVSTVAASESKVNQLTSTVESSQTTVNNLSSTVSGLSTTVNGLSTTVSGLSTTVNGLSGKVTTLTSRIDELEAIIESMNTPEPTIINMLTEGTVHLNSRYSKSGLKVSTQNGRICIIAPVDVDGETECTLTFNNVPASLTQYKDYNTLYFLNADQTVCTNLQDGSNGNFAYMPSGWTVSSDAFSGVCVFTPPADTKYIVVNLTINNNVVITQSNLSGMSVTLQIG